MMYPSSWCARPWGSNPYPEPNPNPDPDPNPNPDPNQVLKAMGVASDQEVVQLVGSEGKFSQAAGRPPLTHPRRRLGPTLTCP